MRPWYSGGTPPPTERMETILRSAPAEETVFRDGDEGKSEYATVMAQLRDTVSALQRNGLVLEAAGVEARREEFLGALLAFAATPQERVQVLKQLGTFRFRRTETARMRQQKLKAVVRDPDAEAPLADQAAGLAQIWRPRPGGFLDAVLHRPPEAGRMLMRRLSGRDGTRVSIVNHRLDGIEGTALESFARAGAVAYQESGVIHLLGGIGEYLRACAAAGEGRGPGPACSPLLLLLLHELAEGIVQAELKALPAHVVASTLERCLGGTALPRAAEAFLVEWESRAPAAPAAQDTDLEAADDPEQLLAECIVEQDELRPEAYLERSYAEQRRILREMFGDDWTEADDAGLALAEASVGAGL